MHGVAQAGRGTGRSSVRRTEDPGVVDAITHLRAVAEGEPVFYLERPDSGDALLAIGCAAEISTSGPARFSDAATRAAALLASLEIENEALDDAIVPRLVGGFSFGDTFASPLWRDFASCRLVLPRVQWVRSGERWVRFDVTCRDAVSRRPATRAGLVARASTPYSAAVLSAGNEDAEAWLARTRGALAEIARGRLDKLVVARREARRLLEDVDVSRVLADLRDARPSCYTFCIASGDSIFLGSSPEKLLGVRDGVVEADALAGTIARGRTAAEDRAQAASLAASEKDLREHAVVVADVTATLAPFVGDLDVRERPVVRTYPEGHHLHTSIRARCARGASLLDIAGAVHPTPAVCGVPRGLAQELLERLEPDRGWYAGGVGWVDARGEGLFAVALRAGLFTAGRLVTWAGAGIVAGSDAGLELEETRLKMRALLEVVGAQAA